MADDTTTAPETGRSEDVDLAKAGLSVGADKDATAAIDKMEHDGTYTDKAALEAIETAKHADEARQSFDQHQAEQAKHAEEGRIDLAQEDATKAGHDVQVVSENSLPENAHIVDAQIDHNWFDQQHLDSARQQEATAQSYDQSAHAYAATGDTTHAATDAQTGADHHDLAAADTHAADAGGSYASHDTASDPAAATPAADPSTEAA